MATAIAILSGVCLLLVLLSCVLALALSLAMAELNEIRSETLNVPKVNWDYTRESGWIDAEVKDDVAES